MMEEKRKKAEQQQQHGPAVGARLYFNYTAGCARASSNLVGPLSLSLSFFLSPPEPSFALLCTTPWPQSASSGFAGNPWYTTETRRNKRRRRRTAVYCPPLQPTLQPLSSRCTASDRFSYSLSLFRNENFYARKKGKERNSFRRKKRGGIVKDDESSFDPFEGEASLP